MQSASGGEDGMDQDDPDYSCQSSQLDSSDEDNKSIDSKDSLILERRNEECIKGNSIESTTSGEGIVSVISKKTAVERKLNIAKDLPKSKKEQNNCSFEFEQENDDNVGSNEIGK